MLDNIFGFLRALAPKTMFNFSSPKSCTSLLLYTQNSDGPGPNRTPLISNLSSRSVFFLPFCTSLTSAVTHHVFTFC